MYEDIVLIDHFGKSLEYLSKCLKLSDINY